MVPQGWKYTVWRLHGRIMRIGVVAWLAHLRFPVLRAYGRLGRPLDLVQADDERWPFWRHAPFDLIVHVGAHYGEEAAWYESLGARQIVWIEADPAHLPVLEGHVSQRTRARHLVVGGIASATDGDVLTLHRFSNQGSSTSVYEPTEASLQHWTDVVPTGETVDVATRTLPSMLRDVGVDPARARSAALILDVQGHELEVLRGTGIQLVREFAVVMSELSTVEVYRGAANGSDVLAWFSEAGFRLVTAVPAFHADIILERIDS